MTLVIGYHKIRGLGAPLRMMCYYKEQTFENVGYGADMKESWFGGRKQELITQNAAINLPYIIDGDKVLTQSNTCLLYLGDKLKIDRADCFWNNHTVVDQVMDLRNDLMKVVYPFGEAKEKSQFPDVATKHMEGSATTNFTKLENFCQGPYMCGSKPQSGDFHVFEMLDQHESICQSLGLPSIMEQFPKLKALHASMKAEPTLAKYFAADCYAKWAQNNGLFTHFTGQGDDFEYGDTVRDTVTFNCPQLFYAPIAGRAELIRLIAAAGGLQIVDTAGMESFGKPMLAETGESKTEYMSPSGMPLLQHGGLKMSQSGPIETYIASIAPKYKDLTVQQRAIDNMYQGIKEEILLNCAKAIFTTQKTSKEQAKQDVIGLLDKWFAIFEAKVPSEGFIQGLDYPTPADLSLLNITTAYMPFGAAQKLAGYDFGKWPKVNALCDRTAADPSVAQYLQSSTHTTANPFGL